MILRDVPKGKHTLPTEILLERTQHVFSCLPRVATDAATAKVSPFYKKTIGYGLPDVAEELNYGVDLGVVSENGK